MDDALKVAVAGTARASGGFGSSGAPIDQAVARIDSRGDERRLLLTAGAHAIRRRAGVLPLTQPEATDIAGDEVWDIAPERVALLIAELLSGQAADALPEALERLTRARLLLPPALLPAALDAGARSKAIRPGLLAVAGARGRWLARHNNAWSWATTPSDADLVANADTIWQEGKQAERLAVLRLVRASDPARGRAMLEETWQRERANLRAEAIDALSVNLSPADQPFLEAALEDRAQPARERADALLTRIPGSRSAREAIVRAEPLIGKRLGFQIVIRPPDGDASSGSERAALMAEAISRVPPSHWAAQLGKQPADLVRTVARDRDWGFAVLDGWTRAALAFTDAEWAAALWTAWLATSSSQFGMTGKASAGSFEATVNQRLIELLQVTRPGDAERAVANAISGSFDPNRMAAVLPHLARPWSADFTDRYLRSFRDLADMALKQAQVDWRAIHVWSSSFQTAALALPAGSIQSAVTLLSQLRDATPRHGTDYRWEYWKQTLKSHIDTLRMRRRIIEEIPG
jgi:hypothetical protein